MLFQYSVKAVLPVYRAAQKLCPVRARKNLAKGAGQIAAIFWKALPRVSFIIITAVMKDWLIQEDSGTG